jgi:hypothetical protein
MIKDLADKAYNSLYHLPPNEIDLQEFAEKVLNQFIDEIHKNKSTVAWNYGLDSVIFINKSVDGHKSLQQIKEEFLGQKGDAGNTAVSEGTGTSGRTQRDETTGSYYKLSEY